MALNTYALVAYYLHPFLNNEKLQKTHTSVINKFLIQNLSGSGLEELDAFIEKREILKILFEKELKSPFTFWKLASSEFPEISNLALKLLMIPASSAQIERVFSTWGLIHTPIRNRLTFERSKKLMHVYYALKIQEKKQADDSEFNELLFEDE